MLPLPSPTTISAANFMTRPPLTVLETRLMETTLVIMPSSCSLLRMAIVSSPSLQLQAGFAGALGERLDAALVYETAAVVDHFGDAFFQPLLGDGLANFLGRLDIAAVALEILVHAGSAGQGNALRVVDDLGVDVLGRAENIQTGTLGGAADLAADTAVTAKTSFVLISLIDHNVSPLLLF